MWEGGGVEGGGVASRRGNILILILGTGCQGRE